VIGRREVLTADKARAEAKKLLGDAARGIDPGAAKRAAAEAQAEREKALTFGKLYDEWLAAVGQYKKSARCDRSTRKKFASIENRKASEITTGQIEAILAGLREKPTMANRTLALLRTVFRYGVRRGVLESDSTAHIRKRAESQRIVPLPPRAELDKLYAALDAHPDRAGANAIKLLFWTDSRLREVLSAKWDQLDLARGEFHKRDTKTGPVIIPLDPLALELLIKMKRAATSEWLFPSRVGDKPRYDVREVWDAARTAICRPELHVHDLRHFYATALLDQGAALHLIAPLLGHRSSQITARYAHLRTETLKAERERLTLAIAPPPKRIIPPARKCHGQGHGHRNLD
jgi:integrase